ARADRRAGGCTHWCIERRSAARDHRLIIAVMQRRSGIARDWRSSEEVDVIVIAVDAAVAQSEYRGRVAWCRGWTSTLEEIIIANSHHIDDQRQRFWRTRRRTAVAAK